MTTDFDKARKWRRVHLVCAVACVAMLLVSMFRMATHTYRSCDNLPCVVMAFITCVAAWQVCRYSKCPHCGKRLMSTWLGRDGAGRNYIRRVTKGQPVICAQCGEEVDTAGERGKADAARFKFTSPRAIAILILAVVVGGSLVAAKIRLVARDNRDRPLWEEAAREHLSRDSGWGIGLYNAHRPVGAVKIDDTRLFSIGNGHVALAEVPCCSKCRETDPDNPDCEGHQMDRFGWVEFEMPSFGSFTYRASRHGMTVKRWPAPREMTASERDMVRAALARWQDLRQEKEKRADADTIDKHKSTRREF